MLSRLIINSKEILLFKHYTKTIKTLLILQGITVFVYLLTLFNFDYQAENLHISGMGEILVVFALNVASLYGLFKRKTWSFKAIFILYFLQLISIETQNFHFMFSTGVQLTTSIQIENSMVTINIFAILMIIMSYVSLDRLRTI